MKSKALIWVVLLGLAIIFPNTSFAFEFDIWESGISLDEAMEIAEFNDIPLTDANTMKSCQRGKDHFQPDIIERVQKSTNFSTISQNALSAAI